MERQAFDSYKPNILPDALTALGAFVGGVCEFATLFTRLPHASQPELSTHIRGASAMLDDALDNQQQFPEGFGF